MFMRLLKFFVFLLSCNVVAADNANTLTPQQEIEAAVHNFLSGYYNSQQNVDIQVSKLDKRIPVPECPESLRYSIPGNGTPSYMSTVKVNCNSTGWYVFLKARISETVSAIVTTRALQKGSTITNDDLTSVSVDVSQLRGEYFNSADALLGSKVKRFIPANFRIKPADICVVCKGDQVELSAVKGRLRVATTGTALTDGMVGETVKIQNNRTDRVISAIVKAIGATELSL